MIEVTLEHDLFREHHAAVERTTAATAPSWLRELRRLAMARFVDMGFPTTDQEEWRFTNVSEIARTPFRPAGPAAAGWTVPRLEEATFAAAGATRLVFVNGRHSAELSTPAGGLPPGVRVESLASALKTAPDEVRRYLARHARYEHHPFAALNTALLLDGAFVVVPEKVVLDSPIHIIHAVVPEAGPVAVHPRNLIVAGESSQFRIVESYVGLDGLYLTNALTEVIAGPNAVVDHCKLQRDSEQAFHVWGLEMVARENATVSNMNISLGAALARNDVNLILDGEGAAGTINGLYVVGGRQHVDNHTGIDHARPHGSSRELYKGVLDGAARGVFNGRIRVRPDAQKTDSRQTNKNLLLSKEALVNSNPQLEIYADDVKCTHGATIGQLDESQIFYLRSRGIAEPEARHILTYAFANDLVERIAVPELRERLNGLLVRRLRGQEPSGSGS